MSPRAALFWSVVTVSAITLGLWSMPDEGSITTLERGLGPAIETSSI